MDLPNVIVGVDTHSDTHFGTIIDEHGKHLAAGEFLAVGSGYRKILAFITHFGLVIGVGVEGTRSYGAELSRVLWTAGLPVHEVNRPNRQARRLRGKSDPLDAYQAAESVPAERGTSTPKTKDGPVECLRVLRAARSSAMKARTISINQIKGILVSAPEHVRSRFRPLTSAQLIPALDRSRPVGNLTDPDTATALTLKKLAARYRYLEREILETDHALAEILRDSAPLLRDVPGVGIEVASQLLVTMGDNPEPVTTEAQFAALVGVAPYQPHPARRAGTGSAAAATEPPTRQSTTSHVSRLATDTRTKEYAARRTAQGTTKKEIMRCLKRYVSRELYRQLTNPKAAPSITDLRPARQNLHPPRGGWTLQHLAWHPAPNRTRTQPRRQPH